LIRALWNVFESKGGVLPEVLSAPTRTVILSSSKNLNANPSSLWMSVWYQSTMLTSSLDREIAFPNQDFPLSSLSFMFKDLHKFQILYATTLKAHMVSLKKKEKYIKASRS